MPISSVNYMIAADGFVEFPPISWVWLQEELLKRLRVRLGDMKFPLMDVEWSVVRGDRYTLLTATKAG